MGAVEHVVERLAGRPLGEVLKVGAAAAGSSRARGEHLQRPRAASASAPSVPGLGREHRGGRRGAWQEWLGCSITSHMLPLLLERERRGSRWPQHWQRPSTPTVVVTTAGSRARPHNDCPRCPRPGRPGRMVLAERVAKGRDGVRIGSGWMASNWRCSCASAPPSPPRMHPQPRIYSRCERDASLRRPLPHGPTPRRLARTAGAAVARTYASAAGSSRPEHPVGDAVAGQVVMLHLRLDERRVARLDSQLAL